MTLATVIALPAPDDPRPPEPRWAKLFNTRAERQTAALRWASILREMTAAGTLTPACGDLVLRLIQARAVYDAAMRDVRANGAVLTSDKTGSRFYNPSWPVASAAAADALRLENSLGLSPRSRGAVTPAKRRKAAGSAAAPYLGRVPAGMSGS